jgi:AcrR family transcriptional regulator
MKQTKRQQQKEQTRQKILETAIDVYARQGILVTRMSDIAEAAGVSHGTVFAHFESQEALLSAVIEQFGLRMGQRTHALAAASRSLREVLLAHLKGIQENEAFYTRLVIETRGLPNIARETLISIQSAISFHISQAAVREMDSGTIKQMPISLLFNTWVGLVHYYLANGDMFSPDGTVIETYGAVLLDHFMKLISPSHEVKKEY